MAISFSEELLCQLSDFTQKYLVRHSLSRVLEWDSFKAEEDFWQRQKDKRKISSSIQGMERGGYIKKYKKEGKFLLQITPKGIEKILKIKIKNLKARDTKWDGKWRIIIFDIPDGERKKRHLFRVILGNLGFQQLQKSVWISPRDVLEQVEIMTNELLLGEYVRFILADNVSREDKLIVKFFSKRKKFKN